MEPKQVVSLVSRISALVACCCYFSACCLPGAQTHPLTPTLRPARVLRTQLGYQTGRCTSGHGSRPLLPDKAGSQLYWNLGQCLPLPTSPQPIATRPEADPCIPPHTQELSLGSDDEGMQSDAMSELSVYQT